ncbi:MAG TPA: SoxR reducing system RseC family protein [Bacteroidales bacterium]|nr:SoxR reducing system RseC family protein [Bacteroidales bacterium]HRX97816.1 SoxR reducing system RseC family protein [Bacteroidales bacterium]
MKTLETQQNCTLDEIRHQGVIRDMDEDQFYVSIINQSACVSCQVKGVCNVTEISEEIIEVPKLPGMDFKAGDKVNVSMQKSLGTRAVLLGYILPFLILLTTLITLLAITGNEGLSGIMALGILVPYYFILYAVRSQLKKTFTFKIESH